MADILHGSARMDHKARAYNYDPSINHAVSFGPFCLSAAERLLKRSGVPLQLRSTPEKSSARRS
jgi:hypothetical protein